MKQLLFILMLAPSVAMLQTNNLGSISRAMSNGDAKALSQFFDDKVELSILDDENLYDKAEATATLGNFFAKHKPRSYSQVHDGTSKGEGSKYTIGNLKTSDSVYRVYVYMKVSGGKYTIQEISISED